MYHRRHAHKGSALTQKELKSKIFYELDIQKVWDETNEDCSRQDLAADKRKSIDGFDVETSEALKDIRHSIKLSGGA